ncbi:hypothetical protein HK102_003468 [Quaeritorhiza haematococci]|nr:hypothetical protein HK102_003468 [Quaeritorhiza haematococci]
MGKSHEDYILRVRAGPSYDPTKMVTLNVNDEHRPVVIDSAEFSGYFCVRVVDFEGVVPEETGEHEEEKERKDSTSQQQQQQQQSQAPAAADTTTSRKPAPIRNPPSNYFKGRNRRYSIMIQGRFKNEWNANDLMFGIDFDGALRLPTAAGLALKVAKWLDPAIEADLYAPKPYVYSPLLCAMNAFGAYENVEALEGLDLVDQMGVKAAAGEGHGLHEVGKEGGSGGEVACPKKQSSAASSFWKASIGRFGRSHHQQHDHPTPDPEGNNVGLHNNKVQPLDNGTSPTSPILIPPPSSYVVVGEDGQRKIVRASELEQSIGKWSFHSRMVPEHAYPLIPTSKSPSSSHSSLNSPSSPTPPATDSTPTAESENQPNHESKKKHHHHTHHHKDIDLSTYEKRKKFFADPKRRDQPITISPSSIFAMDFYDAYFDFNSFSLRLPGISISAFRYWDGQPLRFVLRTKDGGNVFFVVAFEVVEREGVKNGGNGAENEGKKEEDEDSRSEKSFASAEEEKA